MKNSLYVPKNTSRSSLISIIQNEITNGSGSAVTIAGNQTITGIKTFSAAPAISTISNTGTLTLPTSTGTLALVSQIPTNSTYVDLTTTQSISGAKTFSSATTFANGVVGSPSLNFSGSSTSGMWWDSVNSEVSFSNAGVKGFYVGSGYTVSPQRFFITDGTAALPSLALFNSSTTGLYLAGANQLGISCAATGVGVWSLKGLNANLTNGSFSAAVPNLSANDTLVARNTVDTMQNKTFQTCASQSLSSVSGAGLFTVPNAHSLLVGDVIIFPNIGSISAGLLTYTPYTIATTPAANTFTLTGVTSITGTSGIAYYYLSARVNPSANGGTLQIRDATNSNFPLTFDLSGCATAPVFRFALAANASPLQLPNNGGVIPNTTNTVSISGNWTFASQLIQTRTGQTTAALCGYYLNPNSTALTGSTDYFWSYYNTPPTTGSTTGTCATVRIAGAPSGGSVNNALKVDAGSVSLSAGTVSLPSLYLSTDTTTGIYRPSANQIGVAVSGANVATFSGTVLTANQLKVGTSQTISNIQSGLSSCPTNIGSGSAGGTNVVFGVAFSSTPQLTATLQWSGGVLGQAGVLTVSAISTTGFSYTVYNPSGSTITSTLNVSWIAIN
jgi:hypothetical protein